MRGFVVAMAVVALIVALLLTGVLILLLTGNMPSFGIFNGSGFDFFANLDLANRQVYSAADFSSVAVKYSSERITVLAGNDGEVVLEEYMSRWDDDMLAQVSTTGGKLDISAGQRGISILATWRCEVKLYVPREYLVDMALANSSGSIRMEDEFHFANLEIRNTSGSVKLEDVAADRDISITASSGSISAEGLQAAGNVTLKNTSGSIKPGYVRASAITAENSSGSIRFAGATAGTIVAKTSSGSLSFDALEGEFDLSGTSGSIRVENGVGGGKASNSSGSLAVELSELTGDVDLSTSSGSCRLTVPEGTGFSFRANTTSGSIKTPDDDVLSFNKKGNEATGSIGGGGPLQVKMEASSGSVRLEYD